MTAEQLSCNRWWSLYVRAVGLGDAGLVWTTRQNLVRAIRRLGGRS